MHAQGARAPPVFVARQRFGYGPGVAGKLAREHDCIVMGHHGCSALGDSVAMAFRRALNLEEAATTTYRALLLGDTSTTFPPEDFAALHHA